MSRVHRRDPRGDWTLDAVHPAALGSWNAGGRFFTQAFGPPLFLLSMEVTRNEAQRLVESGSRGPSVAFQSLYSYSYYASGGDRMRASGIEVTQNEAERMMRGEHPRDVLFGPPPACGYRLYAVTERF